MADNTISNPQSQDVVRSTRKDDTPTPGTKPSFIRRKVVIYYQTMTVSLRDLAVAYLVQKWLQMEVITHLIVGCFHLGREGYLHLNDHTPDHETFKVLWQDVQVLQQRGLKVMAMLGGACPGSFSCLDDDDHFQECYKTLYDMIVKYGFDGIDLDVEEPMSQDGIGRLIDRLRADFGPEFIITLAPVATALQGQAHLSGFSYLELERGRADKINWYNAQFYNGWGSIETTEDYEKIMEMGWEPSRVIPTLLTHSSNGTGGYVQFDRLKVILTELRLTYVRFGGVAGWEYFNSDPSGQDAPYHWSVLVGRALGLIPDITEGPFRSGLFSRDFYREICSFSGCIA
ncbi:glycoside hydrolase superfamily [Aspergillus alliaceus]|uniref:chitinase n=1 Tax=Petromyces alliaceus TaxID=209559 RepID=A0A5N7C027_PETAA|nr:glycoside hydrolase superfamily [Aspergillus alliaceus]